MVMLVLLITGIVTALYFLFHPPISAVVTSVIAAAITGFALYRDGMLGGAPRRRKDEELEKVMRQFPRHLDRLGRDDEGRRG